MNIYDTGISAVKKAGIYLKKEFAKNQKIVATYKTPTEIVTKADKHAELLIIKTIQKEFPDHNIVSEESAPQKNGSEYTWYIDPIDGTTNFSIKNPLYSVSIACVHNKEIIFGTVFAPTTNELFVAEKGMGARLNQKKIKVSKTKTLTDAIIDSCGGHAKTAKKEIHRLQKNLISKVFNIRHFGSAALGLCYTACGRIDGCLYTGAKDWDIMAGILIIEEAGGKVSKTDSHILATNSILHNKFLKEI